jgi:plasmid stabilization system protein ParE
MKPAAFAPSARGEFEAAAEWYESHASGLGDEFVDCVDEIVGRIGRAPREFPTWAGDRRFRRAVAQRFPYVIFFRELSDGVEVVAIAHAARHPGYLAQAQVVRPTLCR